MKNKIKILIAINILCLGFTSFAKNISIDEILEKIGKDENIYEAKSYKNNEEIIKNLLINDKLGEFNGINISSNFLAVENDEEERIRKYNKTLQNRISYGPFFMNYNYLENKNNFISYGIEKSIKDIFYSQNKNNFNINKINKKLNNLEYMKNMEDKKIFFIEMYKDLLNTINELNYRNKAKEYYEYEVKKMKKLYDLGIEAKIGLESSEVELEDINLKIELLNKKLNNIYKVIENKYNLDLKKYKLSNLNYKVKNIQKYIDKYMESDLEKLKLEMDISNEKLNYSKYDTYMPDIIIGFERIDKREKYGYIYKGENIFSIKFSKKLFSTNTEYKNLKIDEKKYQDDLKEKKINLLDKRMELSLEYENLKKGSQISEKKLEISKKRYEIKKKEYELNRVSYLDVIDAYNKYLADEIESERIKNELYTFIYKVVIKSGYEVNNESEKNN